MPATIHPAFLAIAAVIGIGYAIYAVFSEEEESHQRRNEHQPRPPPPRQSRPQPPREAERPQFERRYEHQPLNPPPNRISDTSARRRPESSWRERTFDPDIICSICLDTLAIRSTCVILECTHWWHFNCIKKWMDQSRACPQCRAPIRNNLAF